MWRYLFLFNFVIGNSPGTSTFCGIGSWFVESNKQSEMGIIYSTFIFQLSFATTATTIVSGAMAERTHLSAYMIFSLFNTVIYCIPAHWVWVEGGFLYELGVLDVAGSSVVHLLGGSSALVAAWMLGPRLGRYDDRKDTPQMGSGLNSLLGMFMLWLVIVLLLLHQKKYQNVLLSTSMSTPFLILLLSSVYM